MAKKKVIRKPAKIVHVEEASQETLTLRFLFKQLKAAALYCVEVETWMKEVTRLAGKDPTPQKWVEAARKATTHCHECNGSGVYKWGACVNGSMTHSGTCFRCGGKGRQDQDDYRRNRHYDGHRRIV